MPLNKALTGRKPRFYKEPTQEDLEANGWAKATINARVRARIIGSRLMAGTVAIGIGTAFTAKDLLTNSNNSLVEYIPNFVIPIIINGVAEIKVERQLHQTAHEIGELIDNLQSTFDNRGDNQQPFSEA